MPEPPKLKLADFPVAIHLPIQWGDQDAALEHLNKAIANGWKDTERLQEDPQLAGLHGIAGWTALLAKLKPPAESK